MKSSKTTRRALLGSLTSLLLCFAMLIGSTFAWFTDTASTSVNKIQAGTLDVELLDAQDNSLEGQTLYFVDANGNTNVLWEPGCTFATQPITIKNNGNLALKYKIDITGIGGDAKLNEVIDWYYSINLADTPLGGTGWTTPTDNYKLENLGQDEPLYPVGDNSSAAQAIGSETTFKIVGVMKETAGNEYQGLKIENIAITVIAKQFTYESDSNNNQYDANATYPAPPVYVSSTDDLDTAFTGSGTVVISQNIAKTTIVSNQNAVAYAITNGQALTVDLASSEFKTTPKLFKVANGGTLTLKGSDGKILLNSNVGGNRFCVLVEEGGTLNIEDGVTIEVQAFPNSIPNAGAIYNAGTVNMNGGKIIVYDTAAIMSLGGTINMNGGEISLKTAEDAAEGHVAYGITAGNAATVNLNAGTISGRGVAYETYNYGGTPTVVNKSDSFVVNVTNP